MSKNGFRSLVTILLLTVLLLSTMTTGALAAAATAQEVAMEDPNVNPPGTFPVVKEPITLRIGLVQSPHVENYETNALTKEMEEALNIKFEFEIFPTASEARQKLDVMINSGTELPDVLIGFTLDDMTVLNYGSQGIFLPLNEYIDTIGVDVLDAFARAKASLRDLITMADGNIYYLPKHTEQLGNEHSQRQWINKVWLDKLGLSMPTTTDEFAEVLRAFRDQDPNGNGLKDEVPFTGGGQLWQGSSIDAIMNAFIYDDTNTPNTTRPRWIVQDGKLDVPYNKEEWREGLRYINMLISEGLLSPLSITQDLSQLQTLLESGDVSQVGVYTAGAFVFSATNERKLEYAPLPPLTGPEGVCFTAYYPSLPKSYFIITKDCAYPEAAFRFGDYMQNRDFGFRSRWGEPEVDWRAAGEGDVGLYEDLGFPPLVVPILPWGALQNKHWANELPVVLEMGVQDGQAVTLDDPLYTELFIAAAVPHYLGKTPAEYVDKIKYTVEETEQVRDIQQTLITYVNESMARFATGDLDLDTQWDSYVAELENIGLSRFIEISQIAYDRDH